MSVLYLDSSAWVKRYAIEAESAACVEMMALHPDWITARHTIVEVTRALALRLESSDAHAGMEEFNAEITHANIVELDMHLCTVATEIAVETGARSLDAMHLAAALRAGSGSIKFITYDIRQANAARQLGFDVKSPGR